MVVAVCDPNYKFLNAMREEMAAIDPSVAVYCYPNADLLYNDVGEKYDAVFINTELESESGIQAALQLRRMLPDTEVVFVTQQGEKYAQLIYYHLEKLRPYAYFIKPVSRAYLRKVVRCLQREMLKREIGNLLIKSCCGDNRIISMAELVYVSHNNRISYIYTKNGECIECRQPIGFFDRQLPLRQFVHISKSCIVNLAEVVSDSGDGVIMAGGEQVYPSRNYRQGFEKHLAAFLAISDIPDVELVI